MKPDVRVSHDVSVEFLSRNWSFCVGWQAIIIRRVGVAQPKLVDMAGQVVAANDASPLAAVLVSFVPRVGTPRCR